MKGFCEKLGYIVAVLGTLGSITSAYMYGVKIESLGAYTDRTYTVRDWPLTIGIFLGVMFGVVILTTILLAISSIFQQLENLQETASTVQSYTHKLTIKD